MDLGPGSELLKERKRPLQDSGLLTDEEDEDSDEEDEVRHRNLRGLEAYQRI